MPRTARLLPEEGVLHILSRGNNRGLVFHDAEDFQTYLTFLQELKSDHPFLLYHYCLMNTHVHFILEMTPKTHLSKLIQRLNLFYAYYYKKKYKHTGYFWEGRFKSILIEKDSYLLECGRYIERNPLTARMVQDPKEWPWSSYRAYALGEPNPFLDPNPIYDELGGTPAERQVRYCRFVLEARNQQEDLQFLKGRFYGSEEFVKMMEKRFGVERLPKRRGRPRKNRNVP